MGSGVIIKALSGFYYVSAGQDIVECKARGKFRLDGTSPLVGDRVEYSVDMAGKGRIDKVLPRKNFFIRPAVANVDTLVFVAANTNPVTDPFLIDRVSVIASAAGCELVVCVNKTDIERGDALYETFHNAGFRVFRTSAETGEGICELVNALAGRIAAFTGNSGVGKSSILNAVSPAFAIPTGEVSEYLGRGKHTTRHVQLYDIGNGTFIADTPGFASFEVEMINPIAKEELAGHFIDFAPYLGECRFNDCAHMREPGCAIRQAVADSKIMPTRYEAYTRLYDLCAKHKFWEDKEYVKK